MYKKFISLLSIFAVFATMVPLTASADVDNTLIGNLGLSEATFNPGDSESITFTVPFGDTIPAASTGFIMVVSGDDAVHTVAEWNNNLIPAGPYTWDGKAGCGGNSCPNGNYTLKVHVEYPDAAAANGIQEDDATSNNFAVAVPAVNITGQAANPLQFNPADAQHTTISYTLQSQGFVTVEILSAGGVMVESLVNNQDQVIGAHSVDWDGLMDDNTPHPNGNYTARIRTKFAADDAAFSDSELIENINVNVPNANGNSIVAWSVTAGANGGTFDPSPDAGDERLLVAYQLAQPVDSVQVLFYDNDDLNTALDSETSNAQNFTFQWDGIAAGKLIEAGEYTVKIVATTAGQATLTDTKTFTVSYPSDETAKVTTLTIDPSTFDPDLDVATIEFELDRSANVTVEIRSQANATLRTFTDFRNDQKASNTTYRVDWDGKDNSSPAHKLSEGSTYNVVVVTRNDFGVVTRTIPVTLSNQGTAIRDSNAHIDNISCKPSSVFEPAEDDEMDCEADVLKDNTDVKVYAVKGSDEIELYDEDGVDEEKDAIEFTWDGTDDDDEYVDAGTWTIEFRTTVAGTTLTSGITRKIEYQTPRIDEFLISKDKLDNDLDETAFALFRLEDEGSVTLRYLVDGDEDDEIVEDMEVEADIWYAVEIDGSGFDYEDDLDIQLVASNLVKEDESTKKSVSFDLSEEKTSSSKANVTNDYIFPPVSECNGEEMQIGYDLEDAGDVLVTIHRGKSGSGSKVAEVADLKEQSSGSYSIPWDCEDSNGNSLSSGFYTYKIVSKYKSTDTEEGIFVVGNVGDVDGGSSSGGQDPTDPDPTDSNPPVSSEDRCANFTDVNENSPYCPALEWARSAGVIQGYADGRFGLFDPINRVELLKVALEANDLGQGSATGSLGYSDVISGAWYMGYLKRGQELGIFVGDGGKATARPGDTVNKVEALKIALESARVSTGYQISSIPARYADVNSTDWFFPYVGESDKYALFDSVGAGNLFTPGALVNRGDVVQMLHRLHNAGVLN